MSRRWLEASVQAVRLGEKYGFPFEANLDARSSALRKFVKEKSQLKKQLEAQMLSKLKDYYQ